MNVMFGRPRCRRDRDGHQAISMHCLPSGSITRGAQKLNRSSPRPATFGICRHFAATTSPLDVWVSVGCGVGVGLLCSALPMCTGGLLAWGPTPWNRPAPVATDSLQHVSRFTGVSACLTADSCHTHNRELARV